MVERAFWTPYSVALWPGQRAFDRPDKEPIRPVSASPLPLPAAVHVTGSGTDLHAGPMAIPAPTATIAIRAVTACGDNAPPASQMTTKTTAVASRITTTR